LIAKRRLKWSLLSGFLASVILHFASAATVAFFPYRDEPMTPHIAFIFLLLPGWLATGGPSYPIQSWMEVIAALVNGMVYAALVFGFSTILHKLRR
jgi:hypothetical protein